MDLYTLNSSDFTALNTIDQYVSAIWTERYSKAGDIRIVTSATPKHRALLKEGTYVARRGTDEVAQIVTQSIEEGLLTAVGPMLTKAVLNERFVWQRNPDSSAAESRVVDYTRDDMVPGQFISEVVHVSAIDPATFPTLWEPASLLADDEAIINLALGAVDGSGVAEQLTAPIGPVYEAIEKLAEQEGVGIRLRLASTDPVAGYLLEFDTYRGLDRTSDGPVDGGGNLVNGLIRLSPNLETLDDLKEINSIDGYKNVVYVYYKGILSVHYAPGVTAEDVQGLKRRVLIVDAQGEPPMRKYTSRRREGTRGWVNYITEYPDVPAFREQNAKDALANHNYIRVIDGSTSPINDFVFGTDYGLGDIIELQAYAGNIAKARVTEYIRAEDAEGEREYPTISVIQ